MRRFSRHTRPIGKIPVLFVAPHKLRHTLRGVETVWLVDQKRGRKVGKLKAELLRTGTLVREELCGGVAVL